MSAGAEQHCDISVLICTFNRCEDLGEALRSIAAQDAPDLTFEIVIVDNNSVDRTSEVIEDFGRVAPCNVVHLFEARAGKGYALNTGLRHVSGEFFAIVDDDLILPPDYISTVVHAFRAAEARTAAVGGKVMPLWQGDVPNWLTGAHWSSLALVDYGEDWLITGRQNPLCLLAGVFKTSAVREVGGYTDVLAVGGSMIGGTEDVDLLTRLYDAGWNGLYCADAVIYHKVEAERLTKRYHRRWHSGHGKYYALMRQAEVERSRLRLLGIPAHLVLQAGSDVRAWLGGMIAGRHDQAFSAELRLRFFFGYATTRLADLFAWKRGAHL